MTCKILSLDIGAKRISLSIKALSDAPARPEPQASGGAGHGKKTEEGFSGVFGKGRRGKDDLPTVARSEDSALKRLRAAWGSGKEFKGGLS